MRINLDLSAMTLREIEDFEAVSGKLIGELGDGKAMPAKVLRALVWITQRRDNPEFTYEDAGDLAISELDFSSGEADAGGSLDIVPSSRPSSISTTARRRISGV